MTLAHDMSLQGTHITNSDGRVVTMLPTPCTMVEPPNLMPPRSACLPLDTKHSREDTKLHGPVGHTPGENPKIHILPLGSQMRE